MGGVAAMAADLGIPVLAVAGRCFDGADALIDAVSLVERFGEERAMAEPLAGIEAVVAGYLADRPADRPG